MRDVMRACLDQREKRLPEIRVAGPRAQLGRRSRWRAAGRRASAAGRRSGGLVHHVARHEQRRAARPRARGTSPTARAAAPGRGRRSARRARAARVAEQRGGERHARRAGRRRASATTCVGMLGQADGREHLVDARRPARRGCARSSGGSRARSGRRTPTAPASRSPRVRRRAGEPAGRPSTVDRRPLATSWTPTIARISVVLPEPLGPSRPVTEPAETVSESPGSTCVPPRLTRRSETTIAGWRSIAR